MIDAKDLEALEKAGFRIGSAEDFLGLSESERRAVEAWLASYRAAQRAVKDMLQGTADS